jgi:S-adenosylmethionine decarboxylase proenzyme
MKGLHLTADLYGCAATALMADADALRALSLQAVGAAGLKPVGLLFHPFAAGGGVTGVVLLAESHLALHTWPELAAATLDVYVCNHGADNSGRAVALLAALEAAFAPALVERQRLQRGAITAQSPGAAAASQPAVNASSKTE